MGEREEGKRVRENVINEDRLRERMERKIKTWDME